MSSSPYFYSPAFSIKDLSVPQHSVKQMYQLTCSFQLHCLCCNPRNEAHQTSRIHLLIAVLSNIMYWLTKSQSQQFLLCMQIPHYHTGLPKRTSCPPVNSFRKTKSPYCCSSTVVAFFLLRGLGSSVRHEKKHSASLWSH